MMTVLMNRSATAVACMPAVAISRIRTQSRLQQVTKSYFSTKPAAINKNSDDGSSGDDEATKPNQPFVQARIQAGEWDPERTNPLYRPKWKSRAQIISAEDFANRPTVGFSGEFESFQDAMVTLSWLDDRECKQIYQLYLELQNHAKERHKKTSHEYVMRVIAQKFNITPQRVAAVVQLEHNEEQYKKNDPDRVLLTEAAEYMDRAIKQEIADAYQTFNLKKPDEFVEDPVGVVGRKESKQYQVVDDIFDVDQLLEDALVREEREARLIIDGHVYIEDVDDEDIEIPISRDAKKLVTTKQELTGGKSDASKSGAAADAATITDESGPAPGISWPTNGDGKPQRPRWKYIAQTVNTRELKKKRAKHRSYTNNNPADTLVEEDGTLREANMADVKLTSWKPVRHVLEHTYQGAKKGWLDRTVRGDQSAWGKAPPGARRPPPATPTTTTSAPLKDVVNGSGSVDFDGEDPTLESSGGTADDTNNDAKGGASSSSSSSDDESSGYSSGVESASSDADEEDEKNKKDDNDDDKDAKK